MAKRKARVGDETFDEFLAQQGILGACEERAIKEIIAAQRAEANEDTGYYEDRNGRTHEDSRRQLDRLLDPANTFGDARHLATRRQRGWTYAESRTGMTRDRKNSMSRRIKRTTEPGRTRQERASAT